MSIALARCFLSSGVSMCCRVRGLFGDAVHPATTRRLLRDRLSLIVPRSRVTSRSSWMATAVGRRNVDCRDWLAISMVRTTSGASRRRPRRSAIEYLTLWAFSTDNWRRPREEIDGILHILAGVIERETEELDRQGAQLRHIGSLEGLDPLLQTAVHAAIERTRSNNRLILTLAFNYSGRQELWPRSRA